MPVSEPAPRQDERRRDEHLGCYVYGIVPADVEMTPDAHGIGGRDVDLVRHGDIAALVSEVDVTGPLGRPEDLAAHERLLDAAAAEVPVLPVRFGAVLTDADAVTQELLAAHHDRFRAALEELEGRVEYLLKARYEERAVLREILADNPEAARLRRQIREQPEEVTREVRIRLGELINQEIAARRAADTHRIVEMLEPYAVAHAEREPTHHEDAAHVAFLVGTAQRARFEKTAEEIARDGRDRMNVRLLGPLAPYDFVVTVRPEG